MQPLAIADLRTQQRLAGARVRILTQSLVLADAVDNSVLRRLVQAGCLTGIQTKVFAKTRLVLPAKGDLRATGLSYSKFTHKQ